MAYKTITRRWFVNSLSIIITVLVGIGIVASIAIYQYYYSNVENILNSRADYIDGQVVDLANDSKANINSEIRNMVQTFIYKDTVEMMALNAGGKVKVTSSGFDYLVSDSKPDYEKALASSNGRGIEVYRLESTGEKIMALTVMLPIVRSGDFASVRYVVSVEEVDRTISMVILVMFSLMLVIICFILFTSFYFIRSIVKPVQEIGQAARSFAGGDMSTRILKKTDDEIGELCDIVNYMADEIQNSETMKNEFISSVSHELRTPLTAIRGWGETLATMGAGDELMIKKGMQVIVNETERLSNMVEELLDFSRIQNGKFTLVKNKIDILAELQDVVLIYEERARRDGIRLLYTEPEMLSFVFGDKNRIKQVFINIIDNAIKYSDSGDTVSVSVVEQEGYIIVVVTDTGCGIAAADLPKVKEKFYKANTARRGSGIGLAVANEIINLHDGDIAVTSELGVGTTVAVRLPVIPGEGERLTEKKG